MYGGPALYPTAATPAAVEVIGDGFDVLVDIVQALENGVNLFFVYDGNLVVLEIRFLVSIEGSNL